MLQCVTHFHYITQIICCLQNKMLLTSLLKKLDPKC